MKKSLKLFFLLGLFLNIIFLFSIKAQDLGIESMGENAEIINVSGLNNINNTENIMNISGNNYNGNYIAKNNTKKNLIKNTSLGVLGFLIFLSIFLGFPIGIFLIIIGNKDKDFDNNVNIDEKKLNKIYNKDLDLKIFSKEELEKMKKNNIQKEFSLIWVVILNIFSGGLFSFFHFLLKHEDLPILKKNGIKDFKAGKAIRFSFIPIFNFGWMFIVWLKLIKRLNFQMKLRNKKNNISLGIMLSIIIVGFIIFFFSYFNIMVDMVNILSIINLCILQSILFIQIQKILNILAYENKTKNLNNKFK